MRRSEDSIITATTLPRKLTELSPACDLEPTLSLICRSQSPTEALQWSVTCHECYKVRPPRRIDRYSVKTTRHGKQSKEAFSNPNHTAIFILDKRVACSQIVHAALGLT